MNKLAARQPGGQPEPEPELEPEGAAFGCGDGWAAQAQCCKYDAIVIDVDTKDASLGMSCPPAAFLEPGYLRAVRQLDNAKCPPAPYRVDNPPRHTPRIAIVAS